MNNLIDIHSHIIPGVDDGAETLSVSDEMLNRYLNAGFRAVIATPHMPIVPEPNYVKGITNGFREVIGTSESRGIILHKGTEVRLSPEIYNNPQDLGWFGLAGTRYLLVDFPSGTWPHYAEDTLFAIQTMGLTPILAHPERYGWGSSHRNTARDLVDRGVLIQVTLGSLVGAFGSGAKSSARELLNSGLVHFTATDAHSAGSRMINGLKGLAWLHGMYGDYAVEKTLKENPSAMMKGESIEAFIPARSRKLWLGVDLRRIFART